MNGPLWQTMLACAGGPAPGEPSGMAAPVAADPSTSDTAETAAETDPPAITEDTGCDAPFPIFVDADADGFGTDVWLRDGCTAGAGEAAVSGDCDDANPLLNPGATDLLCGGYDRNCDGVVAPLCVQDVMDFDIPVVSASDLIVDVTGDGTNDAVGFGNKGIWIATGPFDAGVPVDVTLADATYTVDLSAVVNLVPGEFLYMSDLTGDGRSDLWLSVSGRESSMFEGPVAGELTPFLTWHVASVATGDLDGDGAADVLGGDTLSEQVYLVPGPLTPESRVEDAVLVIDDGQAPYTDWGDESYGDLLAVIGDEDGDGVTDFVAMDASEDVWGRSEGSLGLRVFSGDMRGVVTPAEAKVDWYKNGEPTLVAGPVPIGDINADGFDDLFMSMCYDSAGEVPSQQSVACIAYGPLGPTQDETAMTIWDTPTPAHSTFSPATLVSDLDGDGVDDVATPIGDVFGLGYSATWIVPGRTSVGTFDVSESAFRAFTYPEDGTTPGGWAVYGASWSSTFDFGPDGRPMDWNGDGLGDLWLTNTGVTLFDSVAIQ